MATPATASTSPAPSASSPWAQLLPREHGAWSMLILPFVTAAILARPPVPRLLAALALVFALFLLRAPLIVLARQRWVWRTPHEEARVAGRAVAVLVFVAALAAAPILLALPGELLRVAVLCGAAAAALMAASIWLAIRNHHHSVLFQAVGSVGLAASSLVVALAAATHPSRSVPVWVWLLWSASALHGIAAIPIVHARLALRRKQTPGYARAAAGVAVTFAAAIALVAAAPPIYQGVATALIFSGVAHLSEWLALRSPSAASTKLTTLGLRLMSGSILFTVILYFGLRPLR